MAAEQLQIQVQANVSNAIKGLSDLEKGLKSTETAGAKLGNSGLPQVAKGANQANTAMINLGRTVSDAPFGFIGIANNIGPLVENFTQLRKESGSTGNAFKQLGASLAGPGGLIVGIQLAVAAVQFFQLGLSRWGASSKKAKEEQDKLKEGTNNLIENVTKQRVEFESLVKVARNVNQSENERNQALTRLNEILPDTIGKLTQQNIATEQGAAIIQNYIRAVEARATAELLVNRIAENNVKLFDNRNKTLQETQRIEGELFVLRSRLSRIDINATGRAGESAALRYSAIQSQINNLIEEQNNIQKEGRNTANELINLNNQLRGAYESQLPLVNDLTQKQKQGKGSEQTLQQKINELLSDYKNTLQSISYEEQIRGINQSNQKLETNLDFLKRAADLVGFTGQAYKTIAKDTEAFVQAASNQKIVDVIKAYQTAISELDIKQAVTGQDQLNARINSATDALIKLKTLGVQETNEEFIKLQNTLNGLQAEVGLREIRKRTEEIKRIWANFQLQSDKLNFNKTRNSLDLLKAKIDNVSNTIIELKAKGLTEKDLGLQFLGAQLDQLNKQYEKLQEQKKIYTEITSILTNELGRSVDNIFDSFVKGEDVFDSLRNSLANFIIDIGKATAKTLILRSVTNAIAPGSGGLLGGGVGGGGLLTVRGDYLRNSIFG